MIDAHYNAGYNGSIINITEINSLREPKIQSSDI